ncbi:hypothetical protein Tsubulata_010509, partial [Turnera subulata]
MNVFSSLTDQVTGAFFSLFLSNEAYCEDYGTAGGRLRYLDWPLANINSSTYLYMVAANLFCCISWMLRSINGWSWFNAISDLPPRSSAIAAVFRKAFLNSFPPTCEGLSMQYWLIAIGELIVHTLKLEKCNRFQGFSHGNSRIESQAISLNHYGVGVKPDWGELDGYRSWPWLC